MTGTFVAVVVLTTGFKKVIARLREPACDTPVAVTGWPFRPPVAALDVIALADVHVVTTAAVPPKRVPAEETKLNPNMVTLTEPDSERFAPATDVSVGDAYEATGAEVPINRTAVATPARLGSPPEGIFPRMLLLDCHTVVTVALPPIRKLADDENPPPTSVMLAAPVCGILAPLTALPDGRV